MKRSRFYSGLLALSATLLITQSSGYSKVVNQSKRNIPVVAEVDVLVVGGTLGGVAAALTATEAGTKVLLVAPKPYLGEDLCATLRLWRDILGDSSAPLTNTIFQQDSTTTPLRVKKTLDEALLKAGVRFLLSSYVSELLVGKDGGLAGVVISNRAGRQAIISKVIIDATRMSWVAKMVVTPGIVRSEKISFVGRVVAGDFTARDEEFSRRVPCPPGEGWQGLACHEYLLPASFEINDFLSLARIEQEARQRTYSEGQLMASEELWMEPLFSWAGKENENAVDRVSLQLKGLPHFYVLNGSPELRSNQLQVDPSLFETSGRRLGAAAAKTAKSHPLPEQPTVRTNSLETSGKGDVREILTGLRPYDTPSSSILSQKCTIPVLGEFDVVVVGGGTSGACAAVGAGRMGVRVLVVEYQYGLGGTGTLGLIGKPYLGKSIGFSREVPFPSSKFTIEDKMEWFRKEIQATGGEIWFGAIGCGTYVENNKIEGVVVATPEKRGVVMASVTIDATGNADLAISAGADYMYGGAPTDIAMQGAGLPTRSPASNDVNTDYLLVDESDMVDVWRALVGARKAMTTATPDAGTLIQTRERRRIVGDHILSYLDQITGRTYPDSIVLSESDYDTHGYPSLSFFALLPHDQSSRAANHPAPGGACFTPYRCLLPKGLEGMLVVGLGISMHRDAAAMVRMQRDIHNQGYAAGVAAAMSVKAGVPPRRIDVRSLQQHLVKIGNLPAKVLTHSDSFPLPESRIKEAVDRLPEATNPEAAGQPLAVILSHSKQALPLLKQAHTRSNREARLCYARVLGFMGDRTVVPELAAELDKISCWDGRILQGRMAEYAHLPTPIDTLILALGKTKTRRALPSLLNKLQTLDADVTLSHHRSLALALEDIGSPEAARPLAELLTRPGMSGHVMTQLEPLVDRPMKDRRRLGALREIVLARALFRCGDYNGVGEKILRSYQKDLRGLFARHARDILESPRPESPAIP